MMRRRIFVLNRPVGTWRAMSTALAPTSHTVGTRFIMSACSKIQDQSSVGTWRAMSTSHIRSIASAQQANPHVRV